MGIVARVNDALGIRAHHYVGVIEPDDVFAMAEFYRANLGMVKTDILSIIDESATGHEVLAKHLESMRERFRELHRTSDFLLMRRSAWVCPNLSAWALIEDFLHERHSRDGQGSEVCLVATLEEAGILFEPDEIDAVRSGEGFRLVFSNGQRASAAVA
jgi:hypothetical protein